MISNTLAQKASPINDLTFKQIESFYIKNNRSFKESFNDLNLKNKDCDYNYLAYLLSDQNKLDFGVGLFYKNDRGDLIEGTHYSDQSIIKTADELMKRFNEYSFAVREIILNALIHNDYSEGYTPRIKILKDYIEVVNKHNFPIWFNKEDFFENKTKPTNPELLEIFRSLGYISCTGAGIKKILSTYDKSIYEITRNFIIVNIPLMN